jgi:GGDEF domain-containing protein
VPDPADPAAPSGRAARAAPSSPPRTRRKKKFVLPEQHHDELADARAADPLAAYLAGAAGLTRPPPPAPARVRRPLVLDTRQDWIAALRHESARHVRYGRAGSVVLLELIRPRDGRATDRIALSVADIIRAEGRETDRAARIDALGFRLLLPETGSRAARTLADRLEKAFRAKSDIYADCAELCIEVASAQRTRTLEDAVTEAEARLAARTRSD